MARDVTSNGNDEAPTDGRFVKEAGYVEELASSCFARELVVKRSRFIAVAGPAATVTDAQAFIAAACEPDARHNCWAYKIDSDSTRCSDDGEPQGTAGKPILAAIDRSRLEHVAVVVVRYFGGIKLGASGLARAYGTAAAQCLAEAPRRRREITRDIRVAVPHACIGDVLNAAGLYTILDVVYR